METIAKAAVTAALILGLAHCQSESPAPSPAPEPKTEQAKPSAPEPKAEVAKPEVAEVAAFDAKNTFNAVCAVCHGATGGGDGPAGVALTPKPAAFGTAEFWATRDRAHVMKVIKEGGPAVGKSPLMAAFGGQFTDAQIGELADYVMTFKPAS